MFGGSHLILDMHLMKQILFLITLTIALMLTGCGDEQQQLSNGQQAPGFELERLETGRLNFPDDLKGKVVAIRYWADWCPFCESEMTLLEPVYKKYKDQGLVILAINVRQDRATAEKFIRKLNISYDTLLDIEGEVARMYGVMGLPTTFFVERDGRLKSRILGESTPEVFEQIILEML